MSLPIPDDFGFVTKGMEDRRKHPARQPPPVAQGLLATVRRAVEDHIKLEVARIMAEKRDEIAYEIRGMVAPTGPDVRQIILTICDVTRIRLPDFLGPRRSRDVAWPRKLAYYVLKRARPDLSLPAIAKALGRADHTTVMHGLRSFEKLRDDPPFDGWLADPRIQALLK
jgi:chromosomal replication initiation ATPase DnaA